MPKSKQNNEEILEIVSDTLEIVRFMKDSAVTKDEFNDFKGEFNELKTDVTSMKATMVTKSYLDDKLADLRGDLVVLTRKEDTKLKTLVEVLQKKKVISNQDARRILTMEPFPQLML